MRICQEHSVYNDDYVGTGDLMGIAGMLFGPVAQRSGTLYADKSNPISPVRQHRTNRQSGALSSESAALNRMLVNERSTVRARYDCATIGLVQNRGVVGHLASALASAADPGGASCDIQIVDDRDRSCRGSGSISQPDGCRRQGTRS